MWVITQSECHGSCIEDEAGKKRMKENWLVMNFNVFMLEFSNFFIFIAHYSINHTCFLRCSVEKNEQKLHFLRFLCSDGMRDIYVVIYRVWSKKSIKKW